VIKEAQEGFDGNQPQDTNNAESHGGEGVHSFSKTVGDKTKLREAEDCEDDQRKSYHPGNDHCHAKYSAFPWHDIQPPSSRHSTLSRAAQLAPIVLILGFCPESVSDGYHIAEWRVFSSPTLRGSGRWVFVPSGARL